VAPIGGPYMRPVDVRSEAASVRLSSAPTTATASLEGSRPALSYLQARIGIQPVTAFVFLSLAFGSLVIFITPPLRGPDEISHFLRIYSYVRGELLPAAQVDGRKGIFVERELYNQLLFFRSAGEWFATAREKDVRYGQIMALYRDSAGMSDDERDEGAVFAPFAGTEGYNPIAYLPYVAAATIGGLLGLEFPNLLLLMRLFGLAAFTAVAAYAIAVTPVLKWAFVLIAMLPVSLYNRSVLSADGAALCSAMVITALCLSGAQKVAAGRVWERSLWMTLCALTKQPQIVFVLLELMVCSLKELPRRWRWISVAIVVLPCLVLSPLWVVAVSAEIGAWRLQMEGYHPPEHFDPLWKLFYMWEHPYHFPLAAWTALTGWGDRLWPELIGILGWQDILLRPWTYLMLTGCLVLAPLQRLQLDGATRARVAVMTGLTALGYVALVYLIFFLTYTPLDVDHVRGVQGRYFVIALPPAVIFVAAIINRELPGRMPAAIAVAGSIIAGAATVEALLQAYW
jgi:uncharacterized membrane protein